MRAAETDAPQHRMERLHSICKQWLYEIEAADFGPQKNCTCIINLPALLKKRKVRQWKPR